MAFNKTDIYTSSGNATLFNSWTPYVSKFDTSSFYNWEQDNLPLYDLEERTYEVWEQLGFPTSSVDGLALTVSADTPVATLEDNSTIFTTVSACIAALPKVIRFPVLIEVANFGDLGNLELHNFKIEEGGSIEIINRAFGRTYDASTLVKSTSSPAYNQFHNLASHISSLDLSNTLTDTSCLAISSTVLSGANDSRVTQVNSFLYPRHTLKKGALNVCIKDANFFNPSVTGTEVFHLRPYENVNFTLVDKTLSSLDNSSVNQTTLSYIKRDNIITNNNIGGNIYLNSFDKISVKNCDGPVYIRNFHVDGETTRNYGIEITNSDVILENCGAVRCKKAGFKFNNSKVILSRSAFSYRNYELPTTTTRKEEEGIGFHLVNSEVSVSSNPLAFGSTSVGDVGASGADCKIIASRNYAGFVLENSKLTGGVERTTVTTANTGGIICSELNTGYGFILNNSKAKLRGLVDIYGNDVGVFSDNSYFEFDNLCVEAQGNEGVTTNNSNIIFDSSASFGSGGQSDRFQLQLSGNSQHLVLNNNSSFSFKRKDNNPSKYGNTKLFGEHGRNNLTNAASPLPAVSVNANSNLDLVHPYIEATNTITDRPSFGQAISVTKNSNASLFGTANGCTLIIGPIGQSNQKYSVAIYADNNSEVNVHGPTAIIQYGVDVLVENNSTLNIEPPKKQNSKALDVDGFVLSSIGNHTSVELHSSRACLVANKNSTINMQDCGGFATHWPSTSNGQAAVSSIDYPMGTFDTSAFIGSGSVQFLPNPQDGFGVYDLGYTPATIPKFTSFTKLNSLILASLGDPLSTGITAESATSGGVCVRAVEDSVVNVTNVHFPLGSNTSPLDGFYYDSQGTDCDQLMIWNLADTSRLNASYLSVSGLYPLDCQYHGPSAFWMSSNQIYSGAPSKTPDTGSISVLDTFGAGSSIMTVPVSVDFNSPFDRFEIIFGTGAGSVDDLVGAGICIDGTDEYQYGFAGSFENRGPFRIYWSPKSSAKLLQDNGVAGPAYQIFSQGYNCSGDLSAIVPVGESNASSIAPDLMKLSTNFVGGAPRAVWTSGFYYCCEFVEDNPTQCIIDESAGYTFANAKNATLGSSGRPKKVTLYRSKGSTSRASESYEGDPGGGSGFKSSNIFDLKRDN